MGIGAGRTREGRLCVGRGVEDSRSMEMIVTLSKEDVEKGAHLPCKSLLHRRHIWLYGVLAVLAGLGATV